MAANTVVRTKDGKFAKGNKIATKKGKHKKTKLWEQLGEFLTNEGAEQFMNNLKSMMASLDPKEAATGMAMYKDTLEFFKPKLSRQEMRAEVENTHKGGVNIVVEDGAKSS